MKQDMRKEFYLLIDGIFQNYRRRSIVYIQNHVTNDISFCKLDCAQMNARLDRSGKVQSYFYVGRKEDHWLIIVPESMVESMLTEFEKFIIMEDVNIVELKVPEAYFSISFDSSNLDEEKARRSSDLLYLNYFGEQGLLFWGEENKTLFYDPKKIVPTEIENQIKKLSGWFFLDKDLVLEK